MPRPRVKIELLDHQLDFLDSNSPSTGLVAGFGSGKSYVGTIKACEKMLRLRTDVGYYLPTYGLVKDIAFENFAGILDTFSIPFKLNETDKVFTTDYGKVYLRSMDNPTTIVGYKTGYALIDEADVLTAEKTKKAYKAIVARNRSVLPPGEVNSTDMVSTPEGFKFLYDYYVKEGNRRRTLIQANTLDNPYLPDSYIENLYDTYPAEQLEAYMKGQFVNLTSGSVYRNFDRRVNVYNTKIALPTDILHIGMDFNVTNMAATVSIKVNGNRHVVDEFTDIYDTPAMASAIKAIYPNNKILVYPDAAGKARNTSGKSDHDILRKAGFRVMSPSKNPAVRDRVNYVNKEFENRTTTVNSEKCPILVDALEKQAYNKHGEPDKQGGFDHIVDAFGYEVYGSQGRRMTKRTSNVF